jgi:flagellin
MGLRISTNLASIAAQKSLRGQQDKASHAMQQLSSGNALVRAADDAAGLAISENLRGQIAGLGQARNNANNAISVVQVSEGGLNEISNILIRLRELGVQAASDNIGKVERGFLNEEAQQIIQEADRIAKTTRFGDKVLLDGSDKELTYHVGPFAGEENTIKFNTGSDARASALGIAGASIDDKRGANRMLQTVDDALVKVSSMRANFGAVQNRLQATASNLDIQYENISAANSRIRDTDIAEASAKLASTQVLQQAAVSVLAQANQSPAVALRLIG